MFSRHPHENPSRIWNILQVGCVPAFLLPLNSTSWDVSTLGLVCLVLCLSSVALPLWGLEWGRHWQPRLQACCGGGTHLSSPTIKISPTDLTAAAVLTTLSGILRMSNCCRWLNKRLLIFPDGCYWQMWRAERRGGGRGGSLIPQRNPYFKVLWPFPMSLEWTWKSKVLSSKGPARIM